MKKYGTKLNECKTIKDVIDLISYNKLSKISYYLLNTWIFYPLLMMFITSTFNNTLARDIMFYLLIFMGFSGIIIGIIYFLKRFYDHNKFNLKKHLIYIIGLILLLWLFITCLFAPNYILSFTGETYRKEGYETYIIYMGIFILSLLLKDSFKRKKLFNRLLFVEIIILLISLLNNNLTYKLMYNQEPYTGIFSQFNHYGYYLMFGVILSIILYLNSNKIIYLLTYTLTLYMLILNNTFGCFLSIFITLLLIIYLFRKKLFKIVTIVVIFILLSFVTYRKGENVVYKNINSLFNDTKVINDTVKNKKNNKKIDNIGTNRGVLWKYGIKYIKKRPLTGYGIETVQLMYAEDKIPQSRPHNILIQMGVASGIPGIILYLSFILLIFYRGLKNIKNYNTINIGIYLMCICYFISSMFGNSMFYTTPYFMIFLGMSTSNTYLKNNKNMVN